jgi:membrane-bound lysozyme inhibitor of c-type lysozyme MliC
MKRVVLTLAILTAVALPAHAQTYYHYECKDGATFEVAFYPQTKAAFLQFDGKSMQLPKRFSLTSQRFSKDGTVFRMRKGGMATIRRAGRTSVDCQVR